MVTPTPAPLLALVAAAAGALVGLVAGTLLAGGKATAPPAATTTPLDLAPLLDELRALRRELRPGATVDPSPGAPAPDRRDAMPVPEDTTRLAATVTELVHAVEALALRADALGAQQAAGRGVLGQVASGSSRDVPALLALAKGVNTDNAATQAAWMFVPATEVLRRLGRPTRIGAGKGGLLWEYEFQAEDQGWWLGITIADGAVVRVD